MANKTHLQIITPNRKFFDADVDMVIMRTTSGDLGILPGHIPLTTTIHYGIVVIKQDNKESKATLMGGFAEIRPDSVTIVSDAAEWPHEIDVRRAEESKQRAEKRLSKPDENDIKRAEVALRKATVRLEASSYKLDENQRPIRFEQV